MARCRNGSQRRLYKISFLQKLSNRSMCGKDTCSRGLETCFRWGGAHWCHLANTMDRYVRLKWCGLLLPLLLQPVVICCLIFSTTRDREWNAYIQDWLHGFPGLFTDTSEHIRFLLFSSFSTFYFFGSVCQINLTYASFTYVTFWAHVKIASSIVSYRTFVTWLIYEDVRDNDHYH